MLFSSSVSKTILELFCPMLESLQNLGSVSISVALSTVCLKVSTPVPAELIPGISLP